MAKTWNDFLGYLKQASPATAANLEHGNLLHDLDMNADRLSITIAFPQDAAVFKDFIEEKEVYARFKSHLADFFEIDIDKIAFKSQVLNEKEKTEKNFRSKVEIDDDARAEAEESRRQKILNDPFVKEAEKLFNAKIDKIILKE